MEIKPGVVLVILLKVLTWTKLPQVSSAGVGTSFSFSANSVYVENGPFNVTKQGKKLTEKEITQFSLEEKCNRGLPVSLAWQYYGPYTKQRSEGNSIVLEGIFPQLLNQMFADCCSSNITIKYGKILDSIRGLEGQLDNKSRVYDVTFPLTGSHMNDKKDVSFKEYPYIPVVQAPSVALLVKDNLQQNRQSTQLMKTVMKAWPILIFIIVAATLSGIIIWLLVSLWDGIYIFYHIHYMTMPEVLDWIYTNKHTDRHLNKHRHTQCLSGGLWGRAFSLMVFFSPHSVNNCFGCPPEYKYPQNISSTNQNIPTHIY